MAVLRFETCAVVIIRFDDLSAVQCTDVGFSCRLTGKKYHGEVCHSRYVHSSWLRMMKGVMRRDYFSLEAKNVAWGEDEEDPPQPTVVIEFEGPADTLSDRLTDRNNEPLDGSDIDVAYRLQDPIDLTDARGVVSITHRITGEFILELNAVAEDVFEFTQAVRQYGEHSTTDGDTFGIEIRTDGEVAATFEDDTLLVYDEEGSLLREHSLIPSGVEL